MDTGVAVALIGGAFGLLTAVLAFAQPIVLKLLDRRRAAAPPADGTSLDDPVDYRLLSQALTVELRRWKDRAEACEQREAP